MKFSKNCGTSSYLKVDAVGSAGYEPRVLTTELMSRTVVFYIIAECAPLAKRYVPLSLHTMAVKGGVDSCGAGGDVYKRQSSHQSIPLMPPFGAATERGRFLCLFVFIADGTSKNLP